MKIKQIKNFIGGKWTDAESKMTFDVENPSTGEIIAQAPLSDSTDVNRAVIAAKSAFSGWSKTPVSRRVPYLYELLKLMHKDFETLARSVTEENGKSLTDSRAEIKRAIENIEVACGMPVLQQGDKLIDCAPNIDVEIIRLPIGVFGMISPFNFPAMVAFWFLPYAIATGNTYVLKVSEQTPYTFHLITEMIEQISLPSGVFNLVHGDKVAGQSIIEHPDIKGISFVGSSKVAKMVSVCCAQTHKRCLAMGSAKNHLVIMPDAKIDEVIRNMVTSCYGCAGQRCMAASVIVCVGDETYKIVTERFIKTSKEVIVGNPLDPKIAENAMVMGPVISATAKERILSLIEVGIKEGATLALDGRDLVVEGCEKGHFIGPTVFIDVKPGMTIHRTELFGPVVTMLKVDTLDEAIQIINDHQYGNGASIYTQNGYYSRKFKIEADAGMIGINVGIPAPVAYFPFGGMKNSQFADIKAQGKTVINFFTEDKIVIERYWDEI